MRSRIEEVPLPLGLRLPCADCKWLQKMATPIAGQAYMCGYPIGSIAVPYGHVIRPGLGHPQTGVMFSRKMIEGPIADDARRIECATYSDRQENSNA